MEPRGQIFTNGSAETPREMAVRTLRDVFFDHRELLEDFGNDDLDAAFAGANGYYVAAEDETGTHYQSDDNGASIGWDRAAAQQALIAANEQDEWLARVTAKPSAHVHEPLTKIMEVIASARVEQHLNRNPRVLVYREREDGVLEVEYDSGIAVPAILRCEARDLGLTEIA